MSLLLGCIGDDFTGSTDLANTLVRSGMRTVQLIGVPADGGLPECDAAVVALKSRTIPADEAVGQSLRALEWLRGAGARQFMFKYCSTFDSTDAGNIGPVAEALLEALGADFTIACPAFPETGRTVYKGHLFVGELLLSESGMESHPLTPMTDPNLVRVLARQTRCKVGLVPIDVVARGRAAVGEAFARARAAGERIVIVDAIEGEHLETVAGAAAQLALVTGGSGIARGLPQNFRDAGLLASDIEADRLPRVEGKAAVLAGSCSSATQGQVAAFAARQPALRLDVTELARDPGMAARAIEWARARLDDGPVLVYSTDTPDAVRRAQAELGRERAGELVERTMAAIAQGLVAAGVRRLVVAGGETAGAVVGALGVRGLRIGGQIDPGVPWTTTLDEPTLALALKSGNFGAPDFFAKAFEALP